MKAVFFDFWGTLVENGTYSPLRQTYKLLRVRLPFSQYVERFEKVFMTQKHEDLTAAFKAVEQEFQLKLPDFVIDRLVGVWNKNKMLAEPYPEVEETLKTLKESGIKVALVSNAPQDNIEPVLEKHGLANYFDIIMLSHEYGKLKQEGLYVDAIEKLGVTKEEALIVGDSIESDMRAAEKAGVKAVLIDRKGNREYPDKISNIKELTELVKQ